MVQRRPALCGARASARWLVAWTVEPPNLSLEIRDGATNRLRVPYRQKRAHAARAHAPLDLRLTRSTVALAKLATLARIVAIVVIRDPTRLESPGDRLLRERKTATLLVNFLGGLRNARSLCLVPLIAVNFLQPFLVPRRLGQSSLSLAPFLAIVLDLQLLVGRRAVRHHGGLCWCECGAQ